MGVRRERPPAERAGRSVRFRFPDGTSKTVPVSESRGPAGTDVCCFCGETIDDAGSGRIRVSARWMHEGREVAQSWGAHHRCLAGRMHGSVTGTGPFFGG